ncbi:MAG: (d)CMP kinase [Erysipelotrichaceae bacterium]|nr:(d)CMP kinase [Erysipelotrichaceae bacterium]
MRINIAIDGPSAAGKSTIAKRLAKKYNYIHLDTGAMYRCIALACKMADVAWKDEEEVKKLLPQSKISFDALGNVYLNGENVTRRIREKDMSMGASDVSTLLSVREDLVARQKDFAKNKGIIMDGRDIGTVVLKDAEIKIFLTASPASRAMRRYKENMEKGIPCDFDALVKDIEERDYQDTHREQSPLTQAEDAVLVDTSEMSIEEVVDTISNIIETKFPEGVSEND